MAGPFDSVMKRLIKEHAEDFARWLDPEVTFVQAYNVELQSQHIFADALLRVKKRQKPALLHAEVQTTKDPEMEARLLEYNILASHQYNRIPVYSYVIYLRDVGDVPEPPYIRRFPAEEGVEVQRFYYGVIKVADIPAQVLLELGWLGLFPFVPVTKGGKEPDAVQTMIDRLAEARAFDLLAMSSVIGGLVFQEEAEKQWFKRRFHMFQELIQESWVYQELGENSFERGLEKGLEQGLEKGLEQGLEKGRVEGRVQEQRQILMSFLQTRFPETLTLANQQTNNINEPEVLRTVINKLFAAQTVEEARQILLEINKQ